MASSPVRLPLLLDQLSSFQQDLSAQLRLLDGLQESYVSACGMVKQLEARLNEERARLNATLQQFVEENYELKLRLSQVSSQNSALLDRKEQDEALISRLQNLIDERAAATPVRPSPVELDSLQTELEEARTQIDDHVREVDRLRRQSQVLTSRLDEARRNSALQQAKTLTFEAVVSQELGTERQEKQAELDFGGVQEFQPGEREEERKELDPYFVHFRLLAQSIQARHQEESWLRVRILEQYSRLLEENVPLYQWDGWIQNKLRSLSVI